MLPTYVNADHDEFGGSAVTYTYGHWDGHSALLDPVTKTLVALVGSLKLLSADIELAILDKVKKHRHDARMFLNGAATTREWMKQARGTAMHFVENGEAWHGYWPQLFTPLQLNRYGGNIHDPDPKYDPNGSIPMALDVFTNVLEHLDHGVLSFGYDGLFRNDPRRTCYTAMFPITVVEIGPGFVIGVERLVSSSEGTFHKPQDAAKRRGPDPDAGSILYFGDGGFLTRQTHFNENTVSLTLRGNDRMAIVVWGP
eukprot:SAG31_NODE_3822_length_3852_cov_2.137490_2_plen_255_part_00